MDPRDDLDALAGGVACAACGEHVPDDRIRILARRDDLVFVEVDCPSCRSESLGIVIGPMDHDAEAVPEPVMAGRTYGEFGPNDDDRFRFAQPIDADDVSAVRQLLAAGDLRALLGGTEPPAGGPSR
jgi:hypothetical protein